uniref:Uncharacterized protein n=1 Tax=Pyramimonas obovata TaxID=1411642 RepID=A0A7S0RW69_9CHLO|mmetsp:Transcript_7608/g.15464  ORF Transcript_7608/g.15464 Transcript_7608/m.15464 type:complete len:128 (+) Transcript_7608:190-573(+)
MFSEGDEQNSAGPWYEQRAPVSQQIGKVSTKKDKCGVCELYFLPENLTGIASWKAVLLKREEWGLQEATQKLKKWAPTRLYNSVRLCAFCAQLVVPDKEPEVQRLGSTHAPKLMNRPHDHGINMMDD